jgi:hypothetical protein
LKTKPPTSGGICEETLWNQAPTSVGIANKTLKSSTYFCLVCKQRGEKKKKTTRRSSKALTSVGYAKEHLKTKHLLSVGYAKTTPHFENPALDFCWVCQKKTVENQALTSSVGYGRNT